MCRCFHWNLSFENREQDVETRLGSRLVSLSVICVHNTAAIVRLCYMYYAKL